MVSGNIKNEMKKVKYRRKRPQAKRKINLIIEIILAENFQSVGSLQSFFMFHNLNSGVDPNIQNILVPRKMMILILQ